MEHVATNGQQAKPTPRPSRCVAMVSDCFYPDLGGVENHIHSLSQCLLLKGVKVVVITRARGARTGVRWMRNGLKVYYLPLLMMPDGGGFSSGSHCLPTTVAMLPLFREIFVRESVSIVHCHNSFSTMALEGLICGRTMSLKTILTDHSLMGFCDASAIHMNKFLQFSLCDIDHVVCVSHTGKENLVVRSGVDPHKVSVIPNAVDTTLFSPMANAHRRRRVSHDHGVACSEKSSMPAMSNLRLSKADNVSDTDDGDADADADADSNDDVDDSLTIVVMTRLVYRKGIDLLATVIPPICQRFPHVRFVIGGDGPKRPLLEQMRETHGLDNRVEILGHVRHADVSDTLRRGQILLNTSLTEAFCIAVLEAASCGLLVVSTRVGGVPEVLPTDMIKLADANTVDLVRVLGDAISTHAHDVRPNEFHERVRTMYSWHNVAARTVDVYERVDDLSSMTVLQRLKCNYRCGAFSGKLFCLVVLVNVLLCRLLDFLWPRKEIEAAVSYPLLWSAGAGSTRYRDVQRHEHTS